MDFSHLNGLSKAGAGCAPQEDQLSTLMREYVQAKREFDSACESHLSATQNKTAAEKRLAELSQNVTQVVQQGMHDPTVPQLSVGPQAQNDAQANNQMFTAKPNWR